jgi:hypothetical protein
MDNSKPKYEPPQIVPMGELAEAIGAASQCWGGKSADTCTVGSGGLTPASP